MGIKNDKMEQRLSLKRVLRIKLLRFVALLLILNKKRTEKTIKVT